MEILEEAVKEQKNFWKKKTIDGMPNWETIPVVGSSCIGFGALVGYGYGGEMGAYIGAGIGSVYALFGIGAIATGHAEVFE
ncbi:MAG: hypothetical protein WC438_01710 [Candidatus Pacearchaeota archaeon]